LKISKSTWFLALFNFSIAFWRAKKGCLEGRENCMQRKETEQKMMMIEGNKKV
jgi:hypothetical protein